MNATGGLMLTGTSHEVMIFGEALSAPRILDICTSGPVLWRDGFESGDTSACADTSP